MFLKNHAKSKVFQNTPSTMPFLNIFFQFEQNFDIFRPQSFRSFDQALTSPSGVQRRIYTTSAEREFDGMGWGGISKVSFNFLYTLWVYRTCIFIIILPYFLWLKLRIAIILNYEKKKLSPKTKLSSNGNIIIFII